MHVFCLFPSIYALYISKKEKVFFLTSCVVWLTDTHLVSIRHHKSVRLWHKMLVKMLQKSSLFFLHCKICLLSNYPINVSYKFTCLALPKTILLLLNGMLSLIKSCLNHITQNKADHYKYHDTFQWYNNIQISRGVHKRKEKILPLVLKKKKKSFLPRWQTYNNYTWTHIYQWHIQAFCTFTA